MGIVDSLVLGVYLLATIAVGVWFGRGEQTTDDYLLGGRNQPWLIVGLSILATELSALTFIGVPGDAFAGDCSYLQLYFGSFIGRMAIVWLLLPAFYRGRVTTVYEYLGQRFGPCTRTTASLLFVTARVIGSGLRLLAASIAVSVVFDWPLPWVIVGAATVAVGYTTYGGIKAIIWTDALQVVVFLGGALAAVAYMIWATPGSIADHVHAASTAGKLNVFNWSVHFNDDRSFFVLLIHTLFLNAAVFGTDQDLTHRMLTCSDVRGGQRSLTFNALIGLPVVMLFLAVGVMLYVFYAAFPDRAPTPGTPHEHIFPWFIATALPAGWGLKGLLVAGVFAAAMSSLDSALGALSSTAVVDFYKPFVAANRAPSHYVRVGRTFVLLFGVALTVIALAFATQEQLLWEAFKWASLIFGALLGIFLLGVLTRGRGNDHLNPIVMLTGVALLGGLKYYQDFHPDRLIVAWPWWIVVGTVWTFFWASLGRTRNHTAQMSLG